ncbi:MAG: P-loop NTPase [Bacteroidota bacterium]
MAYSKSEVLFALKEVIYFPKNDNIVNLNMVRDIEVTNDKVSFTLVFPTSKDKNSAIVIPACRKAIATNLSDKLEVDIKETSEDLVGGKEPLSGVKNILGVASGKGGVGKSTVAANLALSLSKTGAKVGLIDADIYGPSVPLMFGLTDGRPEIKKENGKDIIIPIEKYGIKVLSIGFFVDPEQALIWRGPMATSALKQLFNDADWGELDYLVVDLPPGTGDIHLTLVQEVPVTGVAIISTPQEMALADARKAMAMFKQNKINVPVLGLIENMSYFTPPELPDKKYYLFGKEGCRKLAEKTGAKLLGEIPMVEKIRESGDEGKPIALEENSISGEAFDNLARNIIEQIKIRNIEQPPTQKVEINTK